ncbi:mitochondrial fission regulator 1 [Arapaima gigas]
MTGTRKNTQHAAAKMDLGFGSVKPYGSTRSIVRRIASSLPLAPCPRVRFQLQPYIEGAHFLNRSREKNELVASLADVAWVDGENDSFSGLRSGTQPGFIFRSHQRQANRRPVRRRRSLPTLHGEESELEDPSLGSTEAIQKISALETELARLREQIAQIVLAQEQNTQAAGRAPSSSVSTQNTAVSGSVATPPPPPPPPPLPPPLPGPTSTSAIDLIKERRGRKTVDSQLEEDTKLKSPEVPNMLDVLKDLNKVKLRSVKSRPEEDRVKPSDPTDAAALIADALKRKFAHRYRSESHGESDFSLPVREEKPRSETPMFGQHMLKSTGMRKLL